MQPKLECLTVMLPSMVLKVDTFLDTKFECKFVALSVTKLKYLCCGDSSSFVLSAVSLQALVAPKLSPRRHRFLDYVDSLIFFLPFSSKSQAEAARANTSTTHEDWSALREHLQQDHHKPESRDILIKAWKNYVATSFEQPACRRRRRLEQHRRCRRRYLFFIWRTMTMLRLRMSFLWMILSKWSYSTQPLDCFGLPRRFAAVGRFFQ